VAEYSRILPVALIGADIVALNAVDRRLSSWSGAAPKVLELKRRSTFKLLLSYWEFYCTNNKSGPPVGLSTFLSRSLSLFPTCMWRFVIAAKYGRYLYCGASAHIRPMSLMSCDGTRDYRATWDFVTPRSCIIKSR